MTYDGYPRYLVALVFVLGLIGVFGWLLRRFGPPARFRVPGRHRLAIIEIAPVDARRRLVLLRRDDTEHLILLGQTQDLVIETGIRPPRDGTAHFASHLPDTTS